MNKDEARQFLERMKLLDSSELDAAASTPERRWRQLDQIWLAAEMAGQLGPKPLDLSVHDLWARLHRIHLGLE